MCAKGRGLERKTVCSKLSDKGQVAGRYVGQAGGQDVRICGRR